MEKSKSDKFVIIYDASQIAYKNFDIEMVKEFVKISKMYPERLKRFFILKPNVSLNINIKSGYFQYY
jgi:hypothetical protein